MIRNRRLVVGAVVALLCQVGLAPAQMPSLPGEILDSPPDYLASPGHSVPAPTSTSTPSCNPTTCPAPVDGGICDPGVNSADVHSGLVAGASLYILRPYQNNNTALITTTNIGSPSPLTSSSTFDYRYTVSPALWLGWVSDSGVGFRSRLFHFEQSSNPVTAGLTPITATNTFITPPGGTSPLTSGQTTSGLSSPGILLQAGLGRDALAAGSNLRIQTLDFEATYAWQTGNFFLVVSGGGRYLQMAQNYRATLLNLGGGGLSEFSVLDAGHNFYGGGLTLSWLGRYRLSESGLALYGNLRGSLLAGSGRQNAFFSQNIDGGNLMQHNLPSSRSTFDQVLPVSEIELGLEYGLSLASGRAFIRAAAVNQTYFDGGNASSRDGNLSLFGALVSLGVYY